MMLKGARIWLSGSIPEESDDGHKNVAEADRIRKFVKAFAAEVFRRGGTLLHGSHPTIREELIDVANEYQDKRGRKAGLVLVVSRHYSKEPERHGIDLERWNRACAEPVIETREGLEDPTDSQVARRRNLKEPNPIDRNAALANGEELSDVAQVSSERSLAILRETLVDQSSAIVTIGGRWWGIAASTAGVPVEVKLAHTKHLPLFLLGAMGGSLKGYLDRRPELLLECNNGLTEDQNKALAAQSDPETLAKQICDQLSLLPLQSKSKNSSRPFRILCLDGGGIRGVFTAAVLRRWEEITNRKIIDHFDMIAGTSTGGILAIGLGLGLKPKELEEFYISKGPAIFPIESGIGSFTHFLRHWFASKFDQSVLKKALEEAFGKAPVKPPRDPYLTRLLILSYNSTNDLPHVFRGRFDSSIAAYQSFDPVNIALASAAAPTYFKPVDIGHVRAVDGGVWANSPTTIALAEAIEGIGIEPERIEMLSVGTTFDTSLLGQPAQLDGKMIELLLKPFVWWPLAKLARFIWKPISVDGKLGWLPNIAGFLMKTQAQTAEYVCKRVLGKRFIRVDVATKPTSLDDTKAIAGLIGLGEHAADEFLTEVRTQFLNGVPAASP